MDHCPRACPTVKDPEAQVYLRVYTHVFTYVYMHVLESVWLGLKEPFWGNMGNKRRVVFFRLRFELRSRVAVTKALQREARAFKSPERRYMPSII